MASRTKPTIRTYSRRNRVYGHGNDTVQRSPSQISPGDDCPPPLPQLAGNGPSRLGSRDPELQSGLQDDLTTMCNNVALIERVRVLFFFDFPFF